MTTPSTGTCRASRISKRATRTQARTVGIASRSACSTRRMRSPTANGTTHAGRVSAIAWWRRCWSTCPGAARRSSSAACSHRATARRARGFRKGRRTTPSSRSTRSSGCVRSRPSPATVLRSRASTSAVRRCTPTAASPVPPSRTPRARSARRSRRRRRTNPTAGRRARAPHARPGLTAAAVAPSLFPNSKKICRIAKNSPSATPRVSATARGGIMNWRSKLAASIALAVLALTALPVFAQKPIRIGYPVILSGPGALIGEPSLKGAQMFVEELNARGGVLGRKIELVVRDTKGNADEAVRISRELILRENLDFLVGTLTSAEGPAVSPVAKENKIVFVVPVVKTDQLTSPANLHPYVFRTATIEGRTAAELMAKWDVKRVGTMGPDYAFGQDLTRAFVTHLKKLRPDIEIVDQQWPKLGEADYTPFINAQLARRPDAVFTSLWGGHFVTFVKQAKPLKYFEAVKFNVLAAGEAGAIETAKAMGDDYPVGIWANAYDAFNWDGPQTHKEYIKRLRAYLKDEHPSSWPITGYIGMQMLTAAIAKAGSTDSDKVAKAMFE